MRCDEIRLGLRSLYIVPSRFGLLWLAASALLLLVAIQTGSNSSLLLGFLMLGLMLLAMFLTHDTLHGLTLRCGQPAAAFAVENTTYPLILETRSPRPPMRLRFRDGSEAADLRLSAGITTLALPGLRSAVAGSGHPSCRSRPSLLWACSSAGRGGRLHRLS